MKSDLILGDCLEVMKDIPDNSVDSIVTDPPYHLVSIVKRFGKEGSAPAKEGTDGSFKRLSGGFMGKTWDGLGEDGIGIANNPLMWAECLRVLKPGGYLLSFGGTRTYHRIASAIEDAGFEVRDMIEWVYGSGFPKSLNIGKAVDKLQGNKREISGYEERFGREGRKANCGFKEEYVGASGTQDQSAMKPIMLPVSEEAKQWEGWGTALKPAHEPICIARKPLAEKTVAENVLKYGTGGINIDESRIPTNEVLSIGSNNHSQASVFQHNQILNSKQNELGRFPANLIHDNSEEVRECFPETKSKGHFPSNNKNGNSIFNTNNLEQEKQWLDDSGNASRFFKSILYYPKASKSERNAGLDVIEDKNKRPQGEAFGDGSAITEHSERKGNFHPTVKPIALMEYLIKMVTPKGGIVLDPFAGSGSTLIAAKQNGFKYIGIELTEEYIPIIKARLSSIRQQTLL